MSKKILVVDDSASIRQMLEFTLKRASYGVSAASEPIAALSLADSGSYDLVITDVNMPGMDGYAFVAEMRKKSHFLPKTRATISMCSVLIKYSKLLLSNSERCLSINGFLSLVIKPIF